MKLLERKYWNDKKKQITEQLKKEKIKPITNPLNKEFVCNLCKLLLMYKDKINKDVKYFNVEEAYELNINKL